MKIQLRFSLFFLFVSKLLFAQSLYDLETLRTMKLTFNNPGYHQILVDNWFAETGLREPATLEMDGQIYGNVAVRYKGNATFYLANENGSRKLPLNIDMNDLVEDQTLLDYNKIKLANSFFDPTIVRDVLGFQIYIDYMPAPEANWIKVFVEEDYLGLYPNTESINKSFLKKHFDYKNGILMKCDPDSQFGSAVEWQSPDLTWRGVDSTNYMTSYQLKSDAGWAEFVYLLDVLNNKPEELETVLNIDRALWYLAVTTTIANYDSYNGFYIHNYYMYQHKNGLWQFLPWDVSEVFLGILLGNTPQGLNPYELDIFLEPDPFGENRALMAFVRNHPLYRKQYLAHIRTVMKEVLDIPELSNTLDDMHDIIADAAADDDNYLWGLGSWVFDSNLDTDTDLFGIRVAGILSTAEKRKTYLENHPEVSLTPPTISNHQREPNIPQANQIVYISAEISDGSEAQLMVTNNGYASHFQVIEMFDDGTHGDGAANDGVFGASIPFTSADDYVQYYIRAQNEQAIQLLPERAEYEFFEYTIGQTSSILALDGLDLKLSPNPSSDVIFIEDLDTKSVDKIEIYNSLGQIIDVPRFSLESEEIKIDISQLTDGIYFIKINEEKILEFIKKT